MCARGALPRGPGEAGPSARTRAGKGESEWKLLSELEPPWQAGDPPRMKPSSAATWRAEVGGEGSDCRRVKAEAVLWGGGAGARAGIQSARRSQVTEVTGKQDRQAHSPAGPADFAIKLSGNAAPCGRPPLLPVRGQEGQTPPAFLGTAGGTHAQPVGPVETWPWSKGLSPGDAGLPCLCSRHSWASVRGTMARPELADSGVREPVGDRPRSGGARRPGSGCGTGWWASP